MDFLKQLDERIRRQERQGTVVPEVLEEGELDEKSFQKDADKRFESLERELYSNSLAVVEAATKFGDVPFDATEPPESWVVNMGKEEAERRFRYVKAAQLPAKECPAGIHVAQAVTVAMIRAKSVEKAAPKLNVQVIQLTSTEPVKYPEQEIDE